MRTTSLSKVKRVIAAAGIALAVAVVGASVPAQDDNPASFFPKVNPLSGDADAITKGKRLFVNWCSQCHGRKADGNARFENQAADLRKFWRGYPEFVVIVLNGQQGQIGWMPPLGGYLDEDQIAMMGAYLETLAVEGANWVGR